MFSAVFKVGVVVLLSSYLVYGSEEVTNATSTSTTTTTTTTIVPLDLSGEDTVHVETSVPLDPGESRHRSKSHSYSSSGQGYAHQGPAYEKNEYEDRAIEYEKDPRQNNEYYKGGGENNYPQQHPRQHHHHPQQEDYADSYETPYERHHKNQDRSYEEGHGKNQNHPYPDHSGNAQTPYGHQDYSKDESYESKDEEAYGGGRPPYMQYAYEVSSKQQQQATYDPLDVPDHDGKSEYGPGETKVYPPKQLQQQEYYPRPKPTRYFSKNQHEEEYKSGGPKEDNYFPNIPKEAGYASNGQKEPGYLKSPPKEYAYSKQAGYVPRAPEHNDFVPILPKEKSSQDLDKLAILIKHLGHASSGDGHDAKGRQGYLLLPVVPEKMEEKLRGVKEDNYEKEYRKTYHKVKEAIDRHRPVLEKEVYVHQKVPVAKYPVDTKAPVAYVADYSQGHEAEKPRSKSISHGSYGVLRPIIGHSAYTDSQYESPKTLHTHGYSAGEVSEEGHTAYIPKGGADYDGGKEVKTYTRTSLVYGGPHGVVPSFSGAVKYEPASLYEKEPEYVSPYDVTTSHKSVPILPKVRVFQPSTYASLSHVVDYPGVGDYSTPRNRPRKKNPGTSHLYSTHYRNIGTQLAAGYESPKLDTSSKKGKSYSIVLQEPKDSEALALRPSSYSSRGRVSAKALVDDFGLHDFESLLTKPRGGRPGSGSLYYDLHSFPASRGYGQLNYRKAGGAKYFS